MKAVAGTEARLPDAETAGAKLDRIRVRRRGDQGAAEAGARRTRSVSSSSGRLGDARRRRRRRSVIDSHCHLAGRGLRRRISRPSSRGRRTRASSARWSSWRLATNGGRAGRDVSRALWPDVRFAIGVHPHHRRTQFADARRAPRTVVRRPVSRRRPRARAIGEIGLDYHYDFSPRDVQHAGVSRAGSARARAAAAGRDPHARGGRRHAWRSCSEEGAGTCAACCTASPATSALARAGLDLGLLRLAGRHHHVSEGRRASRETAPDRAARSAADRDRQPVSGAGAVPRQAQRAGARRARVADDARQQSTAVEAEDSPRGTAANFHTPVPAVIKS